MKAKSLGTKSQYPDPLTVVLCGLERLKLRPSGNDDPKLPPDMEIINDGTHGPSRKLPISNLTLQLITNALAVELVKKI